MSTIRKEVVKHLKTLRYTQQNRCTGLSTGQALSRIGEALMHPYEEIEIRDHCGTIQAHKMQFEMVQKLVSKLELKGFHFNKAKLSIKYSTDW